MILLIEIWISLTKNPIEQIIVRPIRTAVAVFWKLVLFEFVLLLSNLTKWIDSLANCITVLNGWITWSIIWLFVSCLVLSLCLTKNPTEHNMVRPMNIAVEVLWNPKIIDSRLKILKAKCNLHREMPKRSQA